MSRVLICLLSATLAGCATQGDVVQGPSRAPAPDSPSSHDPRRAKRDFDLGKEHYEAFRYSKAALAFRSAELMDPENAEIHHYRLMAELLCGERAAEFSHPVEILAPPREADSR